MSDQPSPSVDSRTPRGGLRRATLNAVAATRASARALAARLGRRRLLAIALLLVLLISPWPALTIVALAAYAVVAFTDPGLTTALLPLAIPFAYLPKAFPSPRPGGGELFFPVVELLLLLAVATSGTQVLIRWRREAARGAGAAAILDLWDDARRVLAGPFGRHAAAFALLGAFSLLTVADRLHLRESTRELRTIVIEPTIYFFLARAWLRDRELRAIAIASFLGGAAIVGLLAIGQVMSGRGIVAVEGVRRALGTYEHPNALALYLLRAAAFAAAFLALAPAPRREKWLLATVPLLLAGLLLTFSRGALLGLGAGLAVLGGALLLRGGEAAGDAAARRSSRSFIGGAALLCAAVGLVLALLVFTNLGVLRGGDGSLDLRRLIWRSTLAMLRDHPAFGVGLDQFLTQYAPRYIDPRAWGERFTSHPHNLFLDFWVRLGIMGLAWIAWTLGSLGGLVARSWRAATGEGRRLLLATAVAVAAATVHGLVDNFYFLIDLAFVWWLLLALTAITVEETEALPRAVEIPVSRAPHQRRGRGRHRGATAESRETESVAGREAPRVALAGDG